MRLTHQRDYIVACPHRGGGKRSHGYSSGLLRGKSSGHSRSYLFGEACGSLRGNSRARAADSAVKLSMQKQNGQFALANCPFGNLVAGTGFEPVTFGL